MSYGAFRGEFWRVAFVLGALATATLSGAEVRAAQDWDPAVKNARAWNFEWSDDGVPAGVNWSQPIGRDSGPLLIVDDALIFGTWKMVDKENFAVLRCLDSVTGKLRWEISHARLPWRNQDNPASGIRSLPRVQGDRLVYVTNRGELVCLDVAGFADLWNDGPYADEEDTGPTAADIVWMIDMPAKFDVHMRSEGEFGSPLASPIIHEGIVYTLTGHGLGGGADAPSFLAARLDTGEVLWTSNLPRDKIIHGQWTSPVIHHAGGTSEVIFPGGDGVLYGLESATGELIWKIDCRALIEHPDLENADLPDWVTKGGQDYAAEYLTFYGAPVIADGKLIISLSTGLMMGSFAGSPLFAFDLDDREAGIPKMAWRFNRPDFHGTLASVAVDHEMVYCLSRDIALHTIDLETGKERWRSQLDDFNHFGAGPFVHNDQVYVPTTNSVVVYAAGAAKIVLGRYHFKQEVYGTPTADGDSLYTAVGGRVNSVPVVDWASQRDR